MPTSSYASYKLSLNWFFFFELVGTLRFAHPTAKTEAPLDFVGMAILKLAPLSELLHQYY